MAKIYGHLPAEAFVGGLLEKCGRGAKVHTPNNYFGVVVQDGEVISCFNDSTKMTKKEMSRLKMPLFGKAKNLQVLFAPYGFSSKVIFKDEIVTLENGKKFKINFTASYSVEIERASKLYEVRNKVPYSSSIILDKDGIFLTFGQWRNILKDLFVKGINERAKKGKHYEVDPSKDAPNKGNPRYQSSGTTDLHVAIDYQISMEKLYESIGYKVKDYDWKRMTIIEVE